MALTLYDFPLSGHAHRVRLFLSLNALAAEIKTVDLPAGEHRSEAFLAMNPFGQVPVLTDGEVVVSDSNAILVYLAKRFGLTQWLPEDPLGAAQVQQWLSIAAGPLTFGPCNARLRVVFGAPFDEADVTARSLALFAQMDAALTDRPFLTGETATLADVALYSYTERVVEAGIDRSPFQHITRWLERVEALPGFTPFTPYVATTAPEPTP
ncbi:MAG: glutathione S-transferase family protein [Pseudomonadota bacterium]